MAFSVGSGTGTGAESSGEDTTPAAAGSVCWAAGPPAVAPVNTGANTTARVSAVKARTVTKNFRYMRCVRSAHSQNQPGTEPEKGRRTQTITVTREAYARCVQQW